MTAGTHRVFVLARDGRLLVAYGSDTDYDLHTPELARVVARDLIAAADHCEALAGIDHEGNTDD